MSGPGATCGVPGCRQRAVFACSTDQATVVFCDRHLQRWRRLEAEQAQPEADDQDDVQLLAAGGERW